ncbi:MULTISPECIES: ABC transporter permease [unclassified Paenibacillus]|uniref:ABC transporter permease n=1 Tax=unclassified Paenibacillus TaxID=185978 RepID=UPI002474B7F7|nr:MULTISPECIES: ABC transporter permease [unclassified Paenibacillus]MDH6431087.1 putative ABC transport system permease protein [Paenibacillus sp. PastH-4]MDH6447152.1 putative ABC transport system permease protein [Paenibacillus sp. PastF-4]MDH6531301.1 putative ABC transport system permease protein [Paenibacillus sp. PastH-3]
MISTNNHKTIATLAKKSLKANRARNFTIICAIVLTTLLITSVFTLALSINKSMQRAQMQTTGSDYHGSFKYLNPAELEKLKNQPSIKEYGVFLKVGDISTSLFKNHRVEVLRIDENYAKHGFINFIAGGLPSQENEIVLNTWALDLLGAKHELGQTVKLDIDIGEKVISQDFKLSGYYETDQNLAMSGLAFVSEAFTQKNISHIDPDISEATGSYVNTAGLGVMFNNSYNIEQKVQKILTDTGLDVPYGVNPAYTSVSLSDNLLNIIPYAVVILITMLSGYLLIYNIFFISVVRDVKFYGLLKTIGTTPRQLKKIISIQARSLYLVALPFGLGFGYLLGLLILPMASSFLNGSTDNVYSASPWIFIGAAAFSFMTVWIAASKPGRMASRTSPVEAVKFAGVSSGGKRNAKKSKHGAKLHNMAFSNLFRSKKKLILMLSSLSLSIILFSTIFTVISSLDVNKYLRAFISGDFVVQNEVLVSITGPRDGDPYKLSEEFANNLSKIDGVETVDKVYHRYVPSPVDDAVRAILEPMAAADPHPYLLSTLDKVGMVYNHLYGLDPGWYDLVDKDIIEGEFNRQKFASGKYAVISEAMFIEEDSYRTYYHPGDTVTFEKSGKSYEVMAVVKHDAVYAATTKSYSMLGYNIFLPASELQKEMPKGTDPANIVSATLHVDPTKLDQVEQVVKALTDSTDELTLKSREDYKDELGGFIRIFQTVGYGLSLVIALIGVLNYINTVLTGVVSRRNELAMLESIGMTKKQLKRMLILEGFYTVLLTVLITSTLGVLLTYNLSKSITENMAFMVFQMSWLPFILTVPILLILAYTVTLRAYKTLSQASIVERLREAE